MTYMVSVCGANAPHKEHEALIDAKVEAQQLAEQPQNKDRVIHVVQIVATLAPVTMHEWR